MKGTCRRCGGGPLVLDQDGDPTCLQCGFVLVLHSPPVDWQDADAHILRRVKRPGQRTFS